MALAPDSALLSNGNLVFIETLGPKIRAVIKTPAGETIYTGDYSFSAAKELLVEIALIALYNNNVTIVEANFVGILLEEVEVVAQKTTPPQIEEVRKEEAIVREQVQQNVELQQVPEEVLAESTPEPVKPKGKNKLGQRILNLGKQVLKIIIPKLQNLVLEYVSNEFVAKKDEALALGAEAIAKVKEQYCPAPETLAKLVLTRNNIVDQLNNIGSRLELANTTVQGLTTTTNIAQTTVDLANAVKVGLKAAASSGLLLGPALGPVVVNIDNIQNVVDLVSSRITNTNSALFATSIPLGVVSFVITKAIGILTLLDILIEFCSPNAELTPLSDTIQQVTIKQVEANVNSGSYNGFTIKIEEVPFSPTVTRKKAVGFNQSGIALIETALSFTTNDQTLINELKLIIDRDNLKAY